MVRGPLGTLPAGLSPSRPADRSRMSQRKSAAVVLGVTALLAPSLAACSLGDGEPDNQAVCVDRTTEERVPDEQCDPDDGANIGVGGIFFWYFLATRAGGFFPAVGQRVSGG